MVDSSTPKPLDEALKPAAAAVNEAHLTEVKLGVSDIAAHKVEEIVEKAPVLKIDPPELMQWLKSAPLNGAGKAYHIKITDSVIPKSYVDLKSNTIIMSKAFVNERDANELGAHIIEATLQAEAEKKLAIGPKDFDKANKLAAQVPDFDRSAAAATSIDAVVRDLTKDQQDRELVNQRMEAQLGKAHKIAKQLGDKLENLASGILTDAERIELLNHGGGQRKITGDKPR